MVSQPFVWKSLMLRYAFVIKLFRWQSHGFKIKKKFQSKISFKKLCASLKSDITREKRHLILFTIGIETRHLNLHVIPIEKFKIHQIKL